MYENAEAAVLPAVAPGHKICSRCGRELPIAKFDPYRRGKPERRPDCRPCRMKADKTRRLRGKRRETAKTLSQVHRLFVSRQDDRAIAVMNALVSSWGGLDRFIREMRDCINDPAMPPSFRCKMMLAVHHLVENAAVRQHDDERRLAEAREEMVTGMTDLELGAAKEQHAISYLRALGYKVEHPECGAASQEG